MAIVFPGSGQAPPTHIMSVREFRARIGRPTLIAIELELEGTDPARAVIRANLRVLDKELLSSREVDLYHPDTQSGIMGLAQMGFITQERAEEILTP